MKYAVVAALFTLVVAQTRDDIPKCALPCIDDAIKAKTDCATTDYACICPKINDVQGAAAGCVIGACGDETSKVIQAATALCQAQGSKPASSSSAAPAASEESSSSAAAPATSSESSVTESESEPATTMTTGAPVTTVPCETTTSMVSQTPAGNQTVPTTMPVAAGAAGLSAGVAAIALAALAL